MSLKDDIQSIHDGCEMSRNFFKKFKELSLIDQLRIIAKTWKECNFDEYKDCSTMTTDFKILKECEKYISACGDILQDQIDKFEKGEYKQLSVFIKKLEECAIELIECNFDDYEYDRNGERNDDFRILKQQEKTVHDCGKVIQQVLDEWKHCYE